MKSSRMSRIQTAKLVFLYFYFVFYAVLCSQELDASSNNDNCLLGGFYFAMGRDMVVDHSVHEAGILTLNVSAPRECFYECSKNCRCISFNFRRHLKTSNCELNEESRHTAPRSLKRENGCDIYDLVLDYSILKETSEKCINNCCKLNPCKNEGNCSELCDTRGKRFQCNCLPGYSGSLCEKPPTSCEDYHKTGVNKTGNYIILDQQNKRMMVYCDFSSKSVFIWTLIQSFSLANKAQFANEVLYSVNKLLNEDNPNWASYRMSQPHLNFVRSKTTYWRATCSFPTHGVDFRDYVRSSFDNFDLMSSDSKSNGGFCQKYELLNIRGIQCSGCTAATWYGKPSPKLHGFAIDSSVSSPSCQFNARAGSVSSEDNFGYYGSTNPNFRCTAAQSSTTQFWFGVPR